MKKHLIYLLLALAILLSACGGSGEISQIVCADFFCGESVVINCAFEHGYNAGNTESDFYSDDDLYALAERFSSEGYSTEVLPPCAIQVERESQGKTLRAYVLSVDDMAEDLKEKYRYHYLFVDFGQSVADARLDKMCDLILPVHLLDRAQINDYYGSMEKSTEYPTAYGKEDFLVFYRGLGLFEIEERDDGFTLIGYWEQDSELRELDFPFTFVFSDGDGIRQFRIE